MTFFWRKSAILVCKHLGETIDDIQRRTYLMTHIPDKLRFHLIGSRNFLISSSQFLVLNHKSLWEIPTYKEDAHQQHDNEKCQRNGAEQYKVHHPGRFLLLNDKSYLCFMLPHILRDHHSRDRVTFVHQFSLGQESLVVIANITEYVTFYEILFLQVR